MSAEAAPPPLPMLGEALRSLRHRARLSPSALGERAGLPETAIAAIEADQVLPAWHVVEVYLTAGRAPHMVRNTLRDRWEQDRARDRAARQQTTPPAAPKPPKAAPVEHVDQVSPPTVRLLKFLEDQGVPDPERLVVRRTDVRPEHPRQSVEHSRHASPTAPEVPADTSLWPLPEEVTSTLDFVRAMRAIQAGCGRSFNTLSEATRSTYYSSGSSLHAMCDPKKPKLPAKGERVVAFIQACGGSLELCVRWHRAWQTLKQQEEPERELAPVEPTVRKYTFTLVASLAALAIGLCIGAVVL
ncbi:helix-turn-helix domain-containing protein [Saccharothrix sp. HUAS TT1]|uniref:helix-turn-helix domain-containing protein n=1 Tax=unclassified Saccharothrix TaxID=2593673 RepID=UPI00345BC455